MSHKWFSTKGTES